MVRVDSVLKTISYCVVPGESGGPTERDTAPPPARWVAIDIQGDSSTHDQATEAHL